jgi:uncharacterized DUF497 family protein
MPRRRPSASHRQTADSRNIRTRQIVGQTHKRGLLELEDKRLYTIVVRFEWDPSKAAANLRTHGVSFAEAVAILEDDFALTREDPDAVEERRYVTLGLSNLGNLLVVVYTYREPDACHPCDISLEGQQAPEGAL